jgi:hypothetical protein
MTGRPHDPTGLFSRLDVEIVDDEPCSLLGQLCRDGLPDAAPGSGDKRDLSVQFCHLAFAFRRIDVRTSQTRSPLRQHSFCVG